MLKRTLTLTLFIAFIISLLAGCSGAPSATTTAAATQATTAATTQTTTTAITQATTAAAKTNVAPPVEETADLNIARMAYSDTSPSGLLTEQTWTKMQEEYCGVKLNINWVESSIDDYIANMGVYLASGGWADVFVTTVDVTSFGKEGMVVNFIADESKVPYFMTIMNKDSRYLPSLCADDGAVYQVPWMLFDENGGTENSFAINWKFYQENGLDVPNTMTELHDDAVVLKTAYPDLYPINGWWVDWQMQSSILRIWNTALSIYYNGEEYVYGPSDGRLQDMVAYMNTLMNEKLLDPEFVSQTGDTMYEKLNNEKSFIMPFIYTNNFASRMSAVQDDWLTIPYCTAYDDVTPWYTNGYKGYSFQSGMATVINADSKYADLAVKMIDYQFSPEIIRLLNYGVEGVTYTLVDGKPVYTDEILNAKSPMNVLAFQYGVNAGLDVRSGIHWGPYDVNTNELLYSKVNVWLDGQVQKMSAPKYYGIMDANGVMTLEPQAPAIKYTDEEREQRTQIMTAVDTFVSEQIVKFIFGDNSIDDWDKFVSEIAKYGDYQSIIDMQNEKAQALVK